LRRYAELMKWTGGRRRGRVVRGSGCRFSGDWRGGRGGAQAIQESGIGGAVEGERDLRVRGARVDQSIGELQRHAAMGTIGDEGSAMVDRIQEVGVDGGVIAAP